MSKKASSPPSPAASSWFAFAAIALGGILLGAAGTYFAIRPRQTASMAGAPLAATTNPDPTAHRPAPNLTTGQPPAQAARTLGNFYYDHQNWPQAIEHYQSAIRLGSDD